MDDKDRTLKALEDMKESMAYAVRRKQQVHEAVPIVNGGASTEESGTHTPEPWYAIGDTIYKDIGDKRHSIADCHHWAEETGPNARRIVACVNACAGIPTPDCENIATTIVNAAELANAVRELLAAHDARDVTRDDWVRIRVAMNRNDRATNN